MFILAQVSAWCCALDVGPKDVSKLWHSVLRT